MKRKRASLIAIVLGLLLLYGLVDLYRFSGLPWPWLGEKNLAERLYYRKLEYLGIVVKEISANAGKPRITLSELDSKAKEMGCGADIKELIDKGMLQIPPKPINLGDIVLISGSPDSLGFIYAVTSTGDVVKIASER